MKVNWNKEKTTIEKLINEGTSYEKIGRIYGITGSGVKNSKKQELFLNRNVK